MGVAAAYTAIISRKDSKERTVGPVAAPIWLKVKRAEALGAETASFVEVRDFN
jgi:hypothetical protein